MLPAILRLAEASPSELVRDAATLIDRSPMAPRDAFHLAIVLHHRIPCVVTADSDFNRVELPAGRDLTIVSF